MSSSEKPRPKLGGRPTGSSVISMMKPLLRPRACSRAWIRWVRTGWLRSTAAGATNLKSAPICGLASAPSAVAVAFGHSVRDGTLIANTLISTERALEGLLIGGSIGFILGVVNGIWRPPETLLDSSMQMFRNVPHLAIIPLVILWFGIAEAAKVFLVAVGVLFPIYLNTYHGVRTVDRGLLEMGRVYGLSEAALIWRVILPGALPSILVGLRC